jgi:hypothetical protein
MFKAITTGDVKAVRDLIDADPKIATAKLISHKEDLVSIIFLMHVLSIQFGV